MKMKHTLLNKMAVVAALMTLSQAADAAIALDRTRVIYDGAQKSVSMNVSNDNKQLPYLAQGWIEDEHGKKISSPFAVLPPVQRIEPGEKSQVKVQAMPAVAQLPQDRESLFYFNLREIPPKSTKPNTLQLALQTRIKLFYRPKGIELSRSAAGDSSVQEKLVLQQQGGSYVIKNPTPYYITIVGVKKSASGAEVQGFKPVMVPPKAEAPMGVSAAAAGSSPVLVAVNDYGGRPELQFTCGGSTCSAKAVKK